jgi:hypothetical protein
MLTMSPLRRSHPRHRERGQAFVETALTLLVFITMMIGVIDLGQMIYFQQSLVERTRAAARYGSITPNQTTAIRNVAIYGRPNPSEGANPVLPGLTESMVSVETFGLGTANPRITISITGYPIRFFTPGIAGAVRARRISMTYPIETA